jgi:FKBP-type peptidyl-prolyl cis-trans isomerase FkpA/FKBP-type peptidyl-prolyl cis-trans isomerase FklB
MHRSLTAALTGVALLSNVAFAADPKIETDDQKTIYALGLALARNVESYMLTPEEFEVLKVGLSDGILKKEPKVDLEQFRQKLQTLSQARSAQAAEVEKKSAEDFLKKMAAEKGAVKTDSGLIYIEVKPGDGPNPLATDNVKVHYHGTLRDGTVFDSSKERGSPATFPLNRVIPCWTEGVQKMKVGGTGKLVCPSAIAYGDRGAPPKIKPGAALVFEVELLEIVKAPPPAAAPVNPHGSGAPAPAPAPKPVDKK